jgi:hypothetical protein
VGFFSELKDAFREGVEEGREELAAEAAAKDAEMPEFLARIPLEEQFGVALAAPFRVSAFNDWFTIFKDEELTAEEFPKHLYAISDTTLVSKSDLKMLKKVIARDFEIKDETSALWAIGQLFTAAALPSQTEFPYIDGKEDAWAEWASIFYNSRLVDQDQRKNLLTLVVNMATHVIVASANVGYIAPQTALSLLGELSVFTKSLYGADGTWAEYGACFLAANDTIELNDENGMKLLQGHIKHLLEKPGSPWVNVPFIAEGEEIVPFDELVDPPIILSLYDEDELDTVEEYIESDFGKYANVMHEIVSEDIHLDVAIIEPNEKLDRYVLVTLGAGAYLMDTPEEVEEQNLSRMELLTVLPADWNVQGDEDKDYWPIGTLKAMARYPIGAETWLGYGHTVQFGSEEFPETGFAGYLVTMPHVGNQEDHYCTLPDGSDVNFYQLIPLHQDEMDYKIEHSCDALLQKFYDVYGSDYDFAIDPKRKSLLCTIMTSGNY